MSGVVVWFTGKPSSGKSKLAQRVQARLIARGSPSCLLDGDQLRAAIVPRPGYDATARDQFYATLANLAALIAGQNLIVLVAATAHLTAYRARARELAPAFVEVFVDPPPGAVEARDSKGLYAAVREGRISGVPGADLVFEVPAAPDVVARGGLDEASVEPILRAIDDKLAH